MRSRQQVLWSLVFVFALSGAISSCDYRPHYERAKAKTSEWIGQAKSTSPEDVKNKALELKSQVTEGVLGGEKFCDYGDSSACRPEEFCAFSSKDEKARCIRRHSISTPFVRFPYHPKHPVVCFRGPHSSLPPLSTTKGPHSYDNTYFAIDLRSLNPEAAPATIYAAADGTALVHRGCADKATEPKDQACGGGFGNHVRIFTAEGYMLMYAHLSAIFLEDGQTIKKGDEIGREGSSGKSGGIRHLHFSIHYEPYETWLEAVSLYRGQPGLTPPSIPFEIQYCDPNVEPECKRMRTRVENLPCTDKDPPELRADWRD